MSEKKQSSYKLFFFAFMAVLVMVVINSLRHGGAVLLPVKDNMGVSFLETSGESLVCVFKGGQVAGWDWNGLPGQKMDFNVQADRVVLLDADHLAAISGEGKKILSVYRLPSGEKIKDISVGWSDQDVWPKISFDKSVLALVRKDPAGSKGKIRCEFLTLDVEKELLGTPVPLSIQADSEEFIDYAVDNNSVLYGAGSTEGKGRIAAVDLENGKILWDTVYDQTQEFCSVIVSPGNGYLLAGNRDGHLYKLNTATGEILKKFQLLEEGEVRLVTNDYSVLNPAFSGDGQYFVVTLVPYAYIFKTGSETLVHKRSPADKLISKVAFSPDNTFFATSDIRQSYPVKIWKMPKAK